MLKDCRWIVALIAAFLLAPPLAADGAVRFLYGAKSMDSDWAELDSHDQIGVLVDYGREEWPFSLAIDFLFSDDDDPSGLSALEGETREIAFGLRKTWGKRRARPFLGGGLAVVTGETSFTTLGVTTSDDDQALGGWIDAGISWRIGRLFILGLETRISRAEITVFGQDLEAGGEHYGLTAGIEW